VETARFYKCGMTNTGRKTVKGSKTSAPMVAKATQTKKVASNTPASPVTRRQPSQDDIARRSYEIFLERGGIHGNDIEHWAQAERDLGA
jgi:Protein of unknown function (DUF2934)